MANVLVFGHQNPDNDAIMSAVVLSQLLNQVEYAGNTYEVCALGQLPAESAKLLADAGIAEPRMIDSVEAGQLVVLTDHNESAQSVAGLKDATVFGVVDHHRIGDFETAGPLHYICLPWGSSCTIVTKLADVLGVELSDVQAKLLLSAMMTDTLMLKSPTTTAVDRVVAAKLGEQVGVDPVKFGMEVFLTRPSGSFTAAEMVGNDIKMFEPAGKKLLIGQYETMKARSDAPVFLHAVTMQNHTNYNKDNYPDDQRVKVTEAPAGLKASTVGALEDFATGIRDADAMLGRLTDYFSQVDEPVILVFWGDHYNPIDSGYDIYTRSGYASGSSADPRLHQTTLLIWSNYSDRAVDLGTIAAYDISPVMMELFGLRQPAYFQFLGRQLRAAYRANTRGTILEKDGTASNELTPLQQKWSDEHWLLQYDLMFGKGYALSRMGLESIAEGAD